MKIAAKIKSYLNKEVKQTFSYKLTDDLTEGFFFH